jgi:hypothetical protein
MYTNTPKTTANCVRNFASRTAMLCMEKFNPCLYSPVLFRIPYRFFVVFQNFFHTHADIHVYIQVQHTIIIINYVLTIIVLTLPSATQTLVCSVFFFQEYGNMVFRDEICLAVLAISIQPAIKMWSFKPWKLIDNLLTIRAITKSYILLTQCIYVILGAPYEVENKTLFRDHICLTVYPSPCTSG